MKITWIGQAGLLFETVGKKILVDPYLSDSVAKVEPANTRRVPVNESLFEIKPDVIVITH
jgi:L-ascorbate metabolism protein UlaG (beta-lactamase superfamily)